MKTPHSDVRKAALIKRQTRQNRTEEETHSNTMRAELNSNLLWLVGQHEDWSMWLTGLNSPKCYWWLSSPPGLAYRGVLWPPYVWSNTWFLSHSEPVCLGRPNQVHIALDNMDSGISRTRELIYWWLMWSKLGPDCMLLALLPLD